MEAEYRAKSFKEEDRVGRKGDFEDEEIQKKCEWFSHLESYSQKDGVVSALSQYYETKSKTALVGSSSTTPVVATTALPLTTTDMRS